MESIYFQRLLDRDLWVDGESSLHIDAICNKIFSGNINFLEDEPISESAKIHVKKFVSLIDETIPDKVKVKTKNSIGDLDTSFNIPQHYLYMDLHNKIIKGFKKRHDIKKLSEEELYDRLDRVAEELELYIEQGLVDVLKCASYIVDTLDANDIVWGPGRGSACCSYILYLLEVHDIDSYNFDLAIDEFLR